jgi:AraC-like DNA-binding protein
MTARDAIDQLAVQNEGQSWSDYGSVGCVNPLLSRYIANYTYSVGCLREQDARLITRAYPTVMTQIYFEFYGGLSEIKGQDHGFGGEAVHKPEEISSSSQASQGVRIDKRTYIKQGLGSWFDIYQLASNEKSRPIKNIKIDLYPMALFELFQCSPKELLGEDLQLGDLLGYTSTSLMLEEMEAASSGRELVEIAERYFLQQLSKQFNQHRLEISCQSQSNQSKRQVVNPKGFTPPLPRMQETLPDQARRFQKSNRWLQKRYAEVYGMSFKQIQSNLRFQSAHQALWQTLGRNLPISLTELAYRTGYFDQAHFIKDFKRYTGMTPGQYLKRNFNQESQYLWYW